MNCKAKVLVAMSAASLLAMAAAAQAQAPGGAAGGDKSGSMSSGQSSGAPAGSSSGQTQMAPSSSPNTTMEKERGDTKSRMGQKDESAPASKMGQKEDSNTKARMGQDSSKTGAGAAGSQTTVGSTSSGSVTLTNEQKTKIRTTVLSGNVPRATNINFSLNVGTVVPSSVHVVEVPPTLIEIHPEWRGFRYFVVNDEIVIVEPRSLKIVAVLAV